jgi:hypothetical protein
VFVTTEESGKRYHRVATMHPDALVFPGVASGFDVSSAVPLLVMEYKAPEGTGKRGEFDMYVACHGVLIVRCCDG